MTYYIFQSLLQDALLLCENEAFLNMCHVPGFVLHASHISYLIFTKSYRVDTVPIFTDEEGEAQRL